MHVLKRLHDETGFLNNVDCFAGTSAGAQNAVALAAGVPANEAVDVAYWGAKNALHQSYKRWLQNGYTAATYDYTVLEQMLRRIFGHARLPSLSPDVIVIAFDLHRDDSNSLAESSWRPKVFDKSDDREIVDVLLASSAAPTYFPSFQGFIDGGVVATNPSMAAIAYALDKPRRAQQDASRALYGSPRLALEDIQLLSIGTGGQASFIPGDVDWGVIDWMRSQKLIDVIFDANLFFVDFQCRQILSDGHYHRITACYDHNVRLDSSAEAELAYLIKCANEIDLSAAKAWLYANGWCAPPPEPVPRALASVSSAAEDAAAVLDALSSLVVTPASVASTTAGDIVPPVQPEAVLDPPADSAVASRPDASVESASVADKSQCQGASADAPPAPVPSHVEEGPVLAARKSDSCDSLLGDSGFIIVPRDGAPEEEANQIVTSIAASEDRCLTTKRELLPVHLPERAPDG